MSEKPSPSCILCKAPRVARGFCEKHYRRLKSTGDPEGFKRSRWGLSQKHPLYRAWTNTRRPARAPEWDDFDQFMADVGDKPGDDYSARRYDVTKPWGPDNFYWFERGPVKNVRQNFNEYMREWRKRNPTKAKNADLKRDFGIDIEQYESMVEAQGGLCAICGNCDPSFSLAVDHNHDTGKVRGLLCSNCNNGLGRFKDDPDRLRRAADYLNSHIT